MPRPGDVFNQQVVKNADKRYARAFKIGYVAWFVWLLICLALSATLIYVAFHFIMKFW